MPQQQIIEGTGKELRRHLEQFPHEQFRLIPLAKPIESTQATPSQRPSVLGKYAFVAGGSEEFAKEKQAELDREDKSHIFTAKSYSTQ